MHEEKQRTIVVDEIELPNLYNLTIVLSFQKVYEKDETALPCLKEIEKNTDDWYFLNWKAGNRKTSTLHTFIFYEKMFHPKKKKGGDVILLAFYRELHSDLIISGQNTFIIWDFPFKPVGLPIREEISTKFRDSFGRILKLVQKQETYNYFDEVF